MDSIKLFLILIIIIVILHKCFNKEEFIVQDKTHKNNVKKCCKGNNCNDKPKYLNENCEENKENAKKSLNKHFKYPSQDCNVENFSINLTNPAIENIHDNLESDDIDVRSDKLNLSTIPENFYDMINSRPINKTLKASNYNILNYHPIN